MDKDTQQTKKYFLRSYMMLGLNFIKNDAVTINDM